MPVPILGIAIKMADDIRVLIGERLDDPQPQGAGRDRLGESRLDRGVGGPPPHRPSHGTDLVPGRLRRSGGMAGRVPVQRVDLDLFRKRIQQAHAAERLGFGPGQHDPLRVLPRHVVCGRGRPLAGRVGVADAIQFRLGQLVDQIPDSKGVRPPGSFARVLRGGIGVGLWGQVVQPFGQNECAAEARTAGRAGRGRVGKREPQRARDHARREGPDPQPRLTRGQRHIHPLGVVIHVPRKRRTGLEIADRAARAEDGSDR